LIPYLHAKISAIKGLLPRLPFPSTMEELISFLRETPYGPYIEKYASAYSGVELVSIATVRFFSDVLQKLSRAMPPKQREAFDRYTDIYVYNSMGLILFARQTGKAWKDVEPFLVYKRKADLAFYKRLLDAKDLHNELRRNALGRAILSLRLSELNEMEKRIFAKAKDDVERQIIFLYTFYIRRYLKRLLPSFHPSLQRAMREQVDVLNIVRMLRGLERGMPFSEIAHTFYRGGFLTLRELEEAYRNRERMRELMKRHSISSWESYRAEIEGNRHIANLYRALLGSLTLKPERAIAFLNVLDVERKNVEAIAKGLWLGIPKEQIQEVLL